MMIANRTAIARPYATAAFEFALAKDSLLAWKNLLKNAAAIVQDRRVTALLSNPKISRSHLYEFFHNILQPLLAEENNFIHLLVHKGRLPFLPEIDRFFSLLYAQHEKIATVVVTAAIALDKAYQQKLTKKLTARLQQKILLTCEVDPTLIGGAIIRTGDTVIDGSVRGKLNRLLESL